MTASERMEDRRAKGHRIADSIALQLAAMTDADRAAVARQFNEMMMHSNRPTRLLWTRAE